MAGLREQPISRKRMLAMLLSATFRDERGDGLDRNVTAAHSLADKCSWLDIPDPLVQR
jgi:hypothetical protein